MMRLLIMKSKFISSFLVVLLCSFSSVQAQLKWQQDENNPDAEYVKKCLVNVGKNTFVSYMSFDPNSVDMHFYILDSAGSKLKDTIFTYPARTEEYVSGVYKLSDNRVVITSSFSDSSFVWFNMLTCFDSLGQFLYRIKSDTIGITGNSTTISNDTILFFYQKGDYYVDLYNKDGLLLNHTKVANYFNGVGNNIFQGDGFVYKSGIVYVYGYIYLGGVDSEFAIFGTTLLGNAIFTGTSNVTTRDDRLRGVVVDDSSNVYYIGFSQSTTLRKFHVGKFNSFGTIIWQDSILPLGSTTSSPIGLLIKNDYLYACYNSNFSSRWQGRIERYELISGSKLNVFLIDSLLNQYDLYLVEFGTSSILIGGIFNMNSTNPSLFFELDINTLLVDTIHMSQASIYSFPYMIPRDTSGFYYGRGSIVYYFEKTITSISENEINDNSQLPYPNPFYDKLNLECKETDIINFYDYSGRLCLTSIKSDLPNKIHQLQKGNYIVEIIGASISKKFRLVKN